MIYVAAFVAAVALVVLYVLLAERQGKRRERDEAYRKELQDEQENRR